MRIPAGVAALAALLPVLSAAASDKADTPGFEPTAAFREQTLEGWRVLVSGKLLADETLCHDTLRELGNQLYRVSRAVPPGPVAKLREVPIWVEFKNPRQKRACYHPSANWLHTSGQNPDKAESVELPDAAEFLRGARDQPWMLLHELAHAYHHRVLTHEHPGIRECFRRAVASKSYESVLRINGRRERHYALNNEKEYFAELTEAFFGTNDFYPFVRAELREHDPEMFALLEEIWETSRPAARNTP